VPRQLTVRPALVLACFLAAPALAMADEFRFEPLTLPAPLTVDGKVDTIIEASGVEPIGDGRRVLVAHDKSAPLHVVDLATGAVVGAPLTSPKFPATSKTGPKWEGMARDAKGNFYVIGAHSGKLDDERETKSVLVRFRLKDSDSPAIDDDSIVRWNISHSLPAALKAAGVDAAGVAKRKIEGLTIRERDGRRELAIGLREPGDKVRAFVADITNARPDAELELKPLFAFEADPREGVQSQLTSLEYAPTLGGFLVATASEDAVNAFHGNTLYFVADGETAKARKLATFEVAMKCEGLAVLDSQTNDGETTVKLLITYDNDPHATKIPSRYQTARLIRSH
jgi:hypothetical protein